MSEVGSVPTDVAGEEVAAGRAALDRHAWQEAYDHFRTADAARPLSGPELEGLAQSAFFVARADDEAEAKERAFKVYEAAGDTQRAAFIALDLTRGYGYQGKRAIAAVWLRRAERLIGPSGDTYVDGYLALVRSEGARAMGDIDRALELAEQAIDQPASRGRRPPGHALRNLGELKIATGETEDGMALMEEATVSAVNGELTPFTTGITACRTIGACRNLTDYQRATEWIEATERYCERQSLSGFPGSAGSIGPRSPLSAVPGNGPSRSSNERPTSSTATTPSRRRRTAGTPSATSGASGATSRALTQRFARRTPRAGHPACAGAHPAGPGEREGCRQMLDAALAETTTDQWARARLLPARVEVALAAGDDPRHAPRSTSSARSSPGIHRRPLRPAARWHTGGSCSPRAIRRRGARAPDRHPALARGRRALRGRPGPVVLSRALRGVQDDEDADLELEPRSTSSAGSARRPMSGRGARVARRRRASSGPIAARMTSCSPISSARRTSRRRWATRPGAAAPMARRHAPRLIVRHGGEVVKPTGDGFFAAFESALIGRRVPRSRSNRHSARPGLGSPPVRIGLHTADANRLGGDYSGTGVHVAARVAALAGGGEILASAETVAEAGPAVEGRTGVPATTTLKGVTKPVDLVGISWA